MFSLTDLSIRTFAWQMDSTGNNSTPQTVEWTLDMMTQRHLLPPGETIRLELSSALANIRQGQEIKEIIAFLDGKEEMLSKKIDDVFSASNWGTMDDFLYGTESDIIIKAVMERNSLINLRHLEIEKLRDMARQGWVRYDPKERDH